MALQEGGFLVAKTRGEVLDFADTTKLIISTSFQNNTPVTCLACQNCSPKGDICTIGLNMDTVRHDEISNPKANPETLIVEICSGFTSNRKPTNQ